MHAMKDEKNKQKKLKMEKEAALVGSHKNPNQLKNSMSELLLNALRVCFLLFACFVFKTFPVWSGEWYAPHLRCTFPPSCSVS